MSGILARLLFLKSLAVLRHFRRGLRSPRKLLALFSAFLFVLLMLLPQLLEPGDIAVTLQGDSLSILLGAVLLITVIMGLGQRGPIFAAADLDFLFPAPLTPRALLVYRLFHLYPRALLGVAIFFVMFAVRVERPLQLLVALFVFQLTAVHLQVFVSLLAMRLDDAFVRHLGSAVRIIAVLLMVGVGMVLVPAFVEGGGLTGAVQEAQRNSLLRALFYPAIACVQTVEARGLGEFVLRVVVQFGLVAVSILALLGPRFDFFEASLTTSRRAHLAMRRVRRGLGASSGVERRPRRRSRRGVPWLFSGSGAIVYKNLLALSRSLRPMISALVFAGLLLSPMILVSLSRSTDLAAAQSLLGILLLPTLLSSQLSFDFRREAEHWDWLKALPLAASAVTLAELAVPWVVSLLIQGVLLVAVAILQPASAPFCLLAVGFLPFATLIMVTIDNIAFFLFPSRGGPEVGRTLLLGGPMLLRFLSYAMALLVPVLVYLLTPILFGPLLSFASMGTVQVMSAWLTLAVEALATFLWLTHLFERRERMDEV